MGDGSIAIGGEYFDSNVLKSLLPCLFIFFHTRSVSLSVENSLVRNCIGGYAIPVDIKIAVEFPMKAFTLASSTAVTAEALKTYVYEAKVG